MRIACALVLVLPLCHGFTLNPAQLKPLFAHSPDEEEDFGPRANDPCQSACYTAETNCKSTCTSDLPKTSSCDGTCSGACDSGGVCLGSCDSCWGGCSCDNRCSAGGSCNDNCITSCDVAASDLIAACSATCRPARDVCLGACNAASDVRDWGEQAERDVKQAYEDVKNNVESWARIIANGLPCDASPKDFYDAFESIFAGHYGLAATALFTPEVADGFFGTAAEGACSAWWSRLAQQIPKLGVLQTILRTLTQKCGFPGNPAIQISAGIPASAATNWEAGVQADVALAMDLRGNRFCLVSGCVTGGINFPPVPDAGVGLGMALTLLMDSTNLVGDAHVLSVGAAVSLPGVNIGGSFTYIHGGSMDFTGVAVGAEVSADPTPTAVEASVNAGICKTVVCTRADNRPHRVGRYCSKTAGDERNCCHVH